MNIVDSPQRIDEVGTADRSSAWHRRPLLIIAVAVIVVVGVWLAAMIESQQRETNDRRSERALVAVVATLENSLNLTFGRLAGAAGLVAGDGTVNPERFVAFAESLAERPSVIASVLLIVVSHDEREAFETEFGVAISDRDAEGAFEPAPQRDVYLPVTVVAPESVESRAVLGYDHLFDPSRAPGVERARDIGGIAITDPVTFVSGEVGFFAVQPLYRVETDLTTVSGRRAGFVGSVSVAYNVDLLAETLSNRTDQTIATITVDGLTVFEMSDPDPGRLESVSTDIVGHTWTISLVTGRNSSLVIPAVVVLASLLIAGLAVEVVRRSWRHERDLMVWSSALEDQQQRTLSMLALTTELAEAATVSDVCQIVVDRAVPLAGAGWGQITIHDPSGAVLERDERGVSGVSQENQALVPLVAQGRQVGVLELDLLADPSGDQQIEMHGSLGRLVADAVVRTQQRESDHHLAEALQIMLLPRLPAEIGHDSVCGIYRPMRSAAVGGDWYDAFPTSSGNAYLIGDVVGKGIRAAGAMGNLRLASRMVADQHRPEDILRGLDAVVDDVGDAYFATVAAVVADPAARELRIARAGHPPPLMIVGGSQVVWLDGGAGPPLGVPGTGERCSASVPFTESCLLVLYTDGLVERRNEAIDDGLERLAAVILKYVGLPLGGLCESVVHDMMSDVDQRDDVAVLMIELAAPC